jgi:hypothetical protein
MMRSFDKYLENSIYPLWPDMQNVEGKRVLLKIDSGPGRAYLEMICKARLRGLYLYPGLPDATTVQQETDINYAAEVGNRERDIQAMEGDKAVRLEHASRLKEALPIPDKLEKQLSNDHTTLKGNELDVCW